MIRYYVWYRDYSGNLCKVWTDAESKDEAKENVRMEWSVKGFVDCIADRVIDNEIIDELYEDLSDNYPFISASKKVVEQFWRKFKSKRMDLLVDYIMSQDLVDEVEL